MRERDYPVSFLVMPSFQILSDFYVVMSFNVWVGQKIAFSILKVSV